MEIIRHGNLMPIRFECQKCGCAFIADLNEYKEAYSNRDKYLIVNCPDCNNIAYVSERDATFVAMQR